MIKTVLIHGRQPVLGRAEAESLFGADVLSSLGEVASCLTIPHEEIDFKRLGGSMKLAKILHILETASWDKVEAHLAENIPKHLQYVPEGKFHLGLSVYGLDISVGKLNASALSLKKVIRNAGRSVRVVPNKQLELNSAQVLHNQLTGPSGWELLLIKDGNRTIFAQTAAIQDIEAYAARDQARPKRDAKVGMLPPKLAQIIVNLATGQIKGGGRRAEGEVKIDSALTILDPFCGTGVILQEAALMGYNVYGTDTEPRMVDYTRINLDWLKIKLPIGKRIFVEVADATTATWDETFDHIATETYLGRPFSAPPNPEVLREVIQDVDTIHRKFLKNLARQTKPGFRLCIAAPAWAMPKPSALSPQPFKHLPCLDHLTDMGYTRLSFQHIRNEDLVYHRENQIVARELVTLIRK